MRVKLVLKLSVESSIFDLSSLKSRKPSSETVSDGPSCRSAERSLDFFCFFHAGLVEENDAAGIWGFEGGLI